MLIESEREIEAVSRPLLVKSIAHWQHKADPAAVGVIGVLRGEGVGPELVDCALSLLEGLLAHSARRFDIRTGGLIGYPARERYGASLSQEVIDFASDIFAGGGALFCGPGGERFVYELRREFELYCKFTPLEPLPELYDAGVVRPEVVAAADIIAVRENCGGLYQGDWSIECDAQGEEIASHRFSYTQADVQRILAVALHLAASRRKRVHLVLKPGGVPSISQLWSKLARQMAPQAGVELVEHEIDNALYQLIANPAQFDVLVSPNMFGDVLADCGSLLLASRGLSYSGNFGVLGRAVYQTGHGAARDIAGTDTANPIGQILSLGMMLRESFGWPQADAALRSAIRACLREGYRTKDVARPGTQVLGTRDFTAQVRRQLERLLQDREI